MWKDRMEQTDKKISRHGHSNKKNYKKRKKRVVYRDFGLVLSIMFWFGCIKVSFGY